MREMAAARCLRGLKTEKLADDLTVLSRLVAFKIGGG